VHGAFADASSWNGVIEGLQAKGARHGPGESTARDLDRLGLHRRLSRRDHNLATWIEQVAPR
jgi:hypothetical protein